MAIKVLEVRRAPKALNNGIGLVTFGYIRTEFDQPVVTTRYVKPAATAPDGTHGKNYPVMTCVDGTKFKFHNVVIQQGERGPFLALNADIPIEAQREVVRLAVLMIQELEPDSQNPDEIPW